MITPEQEIECQPTATGLGQQQIVCTVDGQQVQIDEDSDEDVEPQQLSARVYHNNARKSDVIIEAQNIAVRFNGRRAWLKVSAEYKNGLCGLCGHYDDSDEREDEWRMANGQIGRGSESSRGADGEGPEVEEISKKCKQKFLSGAKKFRKNCQKKLLG